MQQEMRLACRNHDKPAAGSTLSTTAASPGILPAMPSASAATQICLMSMVLTAVVTDLRSHRIPNWLVTAGLLVAMIVQIAQAGFATGLQQWCFGALTGFLPFVLLYVVGG